MAFTTSDFAAGSDQDRLDFLNGDTRLLVDRAGGHRLIAAARHVAG